MRGVAFFRANLLAAYGGAKRPRENDACPPKKIMLEETLQELCEPTDHVQKFIRADPWRNDRNHSADCTKTKC